MKNKTIQTFKYAWATRKVWWYTASARTRARFARTSLGGFWLGLSNLLSIAALSAVYGVVFKVQNFGVYVVYLGVGLVIPMITVLTENDIVSKYNQLEPLFKAMNYPSNEMIIIYSMIIFLSIFLETLINFSEIVNHNNTYYN